MSTDEQLTLFDDVPIPSVVVPMRFPVPEKAHYRRLTGCAHVYCDDCILALHQARWIGPAPFAAAWEQRIGKEKLRLCQAHYAQARLRERRAVA